MSVCAAGDCPKTAGWLGMCKTHYDQSRNDGRPQTEDKVIYRRARQRATADLLVRHEAEFRTLYDEHLAAARQEAVVLRQHAPEPTAVVKLRPGPKAGQSVVSRIDVGNCPSCARHHDGGHECPTCHTDLTGWLSAADDAGRLAVLKRMTCSRCGKDGTFRGGRCLDSFGRRHTEHDYSLRASS